MTARPILPTADALAAIQRVIDAEGPRHCPLILLFPKGRVHSEAYRASCRDWLIEYAARHDDNADKRAEAYALMGWIAHQKIAPPTPRPARRPNRRIAP